MAPLDRVADGSSDHEYVGHAAGHLVVSAQGGPAAVDDWNRRLVAQPPPAVDVGARERILDEADYGVAAFELGDERLHDAEGTAGAVEVVVEAKPVWCDVGCGLCLPQGVVLRARVHLEDAVALVDSPLYLAGEHAGRAWARPGSNGSGVSHLLAEQLVDRNFEVLAHGVVEGHAEAEVHVGEHEVERAAVDQGLDHRPGRRRAGPVVVAVADYAGVRGDLEDHATVDVAHACAALGVVVALGQPGMYGDDLDVCDLHVCLLLDAV